MGMTRQQLMNECDMLQGNINRMMFTNDAAVDEIYLMACEYMAKTELYDRSLTNCRSPWDKTEAFLDNPHVKKLSNEYAAQLKRYYSEICGGTWQLIHNEIHKHTKYTAQMWIDEYYRLREVLEDGEHF